MCMPASASTCRDMVTGEVYIFEKHLTGCIESRAGTHNGRQNLIVPRSMQLKKCKFSRIHVAVARMVKWFLLLQIQLV